MWCLVLDMTVNCLYLSVLSILKLGWMDVFYFSVVDRKKQSMIFIKDGSSMWKNRINHKKKQLNKKEKEKEVGKFHMFLGKYFITSWVICNETLL